MAEKAIIVTGAGSGICRAAAFGENVAYCTSEFCVVGLTTTGARDSGGRGIRVTRSAGDDAEAGLVPLG